MCLQISLACYVRAVPPLLRKLFIGYFAPAAPFSLNSGMLQRGSGIAQEPSPGPVLVQALQDPKPGETLPSRKPLSLSEQHPLAEHPQPPLCTAWGHLPPCHPYPTTAFSR